MNFERLKFLREDNDLKQQDMANILNVKQVNISNWERGKEIIPLTKVNIISNYFNVSMDYLLKISDHKETLNISKLDSNAIGKRLRLVREINLLSQRELASIINTSHSGISNYESGKSLILTAFAYQICKRYNISLDWLCGKSNVTTLNKNILETKEVNN